MKHLFFISILLSASLVFAAKPISKSISKPASKPVYQIVTDTSINGIKSSSVMTVKEGESGSMESVVANLGGRFQEVTITQIEQDGKPALHMDFLVGEVDRFGNKSVVATPKIIANVGEKVTVIMGEAAGGKKLIFSAKATVARK